MKILKTETSTITYVQTDSKDYPFYRRLFPNNWERLMGESWEPCYMEEDDLERAYRNYND